jgi:predicted component of viral defense system (DUF524 family)
VSPCCRYKERVALYSLHFKHDYEIVSPCCEYFIIFKIAVKKILIAIQRSEHEQR